MEKNRVKIDEALFDRIARSDKEAFEELYRVTYKPVYAFLVSLTQNQEDAKDLLQDTYLKIYGASKQYVSKGNPMAWIMKIAKNEFLMDYRRKQRIDSNPIEDVSIAIPFNQIENAENRMLLQKAFEILHEDEREVLLLYQVAGLKHKEIADVTGMPIGTVLAKYHRGLKKLKQQFDV